MDLKSFHWILITCFLWGCEPHSEYSSADGLLLGQSTENDATLLFENPELESRGPASLGCDDQSHAYATELIAEIRRSAPKQCESDSECVVTYAGTDCSDIQEYVVYSEEANSSAVDAMNTAIQNFNRVSDAIANSCSEAGQNGGTCSLVSEPVFLKCLNSKCAILD